MVGNALHNLLNIDVPFVIAESLRAELLELLEEVVSGACGCGTVSAPEALVLIFKLLEEAGSEGCC